MPITLESIRKTSEVQPPIMLVYGVAGVGKTTFFADAPNPIFIQTEKGDGLLTIDAFPRVKTFSEVLECINVLGNENHNFKWLVIDTLSALQDLVFKAVCDEGDKSSIEEFGYGKGYAYAMEKWQMLLEWLSALRDAKNMSIALLAHTEVMTFHDPEGENYDKYHIALDKRPMKLLRESCDIIGFMNYRVYKRKFAGEERYKGGASQRMLYLREKSAFVAKNRYKLPDEIMIPDSDHPFANFASAFEAVINK